VLGALLALLAAFQFLTLDGGGSAAILLMGFGMGQTVVFAGLWGLETWAWKWALVLQGVNTVGLLVIPNLVGAAVSLLVFVYLFGSSELFD